jgi:hypothetical protein
MGIYTFFQYLILKIIYIFKNINITRLKIYLLSLISKEFIVLFEI